MQSTEPRIANSALARILDEHDMRISTLVDRVGSLDHKVDAIIGAVADLKTVMAANQAKATISFGGVLAYTRDLAVLVGLAVTAIVWITLSSTSRESTLLHYRIEQIEREYNKQPPSPAVLPPAR